ncbi:MAG: alpha-amylase family glycosyl hydrolase [Ilumatobacteraceae bacterium]
MNAASANTPITRLVGHDWWRGGVGYEIYIRSFLDCNGDGMGDLPGVTAKLGYLAELGIDVFWITPFYPSPGKDAGYDVADYVDIDPQFGTLADFDLLVAAAHEHGLRIFADIVPNHSSDQHPWFQSAINDVDSEYRDYYLFRPAGPDGGPPNNWVSHFGGPAWTLDPAGTGEYYCHLFLPEQPDLNWANPAVMDEFLTILRFWVDRGIDGFRIDVAHGLTKDPEFRNNPQTRQITAGMHPTEVFESFDHIYDLHRIETTLIYQRWHEELAPFGTILLGEMDTANIERFNEYVGTGAGLDGGFVLTVSSLLWHPKTIISDLLTFANAANGGAAWALSNHDQPRVGSRFGGGDNGVHRALAAMTIMIALDGITFLYQAEELGLPNAVVVGANQDPISTRNEGAAGRDVARGPVPWTDGPNNGFTTAGVTWLETEALPVELTVAAQIADPNSHHHRYQQMIALRKRLPQLWQQPMEVVLRTDTELIIRRGDLTVVANLGPEAYDFVTRGPFEIEFESRESGATITVHGLRVHPESTVVIRHDAHLEPEPSP